jgi:hypothetical protein
MSEGDRLCLGRRMPREHASDTGPGLMNHLGGNLCQYPHVSAAREVRMPLRATSRTPDSVNIQYLIMALTDSEDNRFINQSRQTTYVERRSAAGSMQGGH